ncbi:hypothetical protein HPP92_016693 [Vanilla planifolia]|uniref:Uncharacterized protein n=1 Tax=Vanilla planifolia TaxID=51239 RepID=A0A835QEJ9_VANPL|nr:hypothetical protein HPP92_016693 [Vanilla planifolia]
MAASFLYKQRRRKGERKGPNAEKTPQPGPRDCPIPFTYTIIGSYSEGGQNSVLDTETSGFLKKRSQTNRCMAVPCVCILDHPTDRILMGPQSHAARLVWAFGPVSDGPTPKE